MGSWVGIMTKREIELTKQIENYKAILKVLYVILIEIVLATIYLIWRG